MKEMLKERLFDSWKSTVLGTVFLTFLGFMAWLEPAWRNPATLIAVIPAIAAMFKKEKKVDGNDEPPSHNDPPR